MICLAVFGEAEAVPEERHAGRGLLLEAQPLAGNRLHLPAPGLGGGAEGNGLAKDAGGEGDSEPTGFFIFSLSFFWGGFLHFFVSQFFGCCF